MVAVPGSDSKSFTTKISQEFSSLLRGRSWMPLVAKICDARDLLGLPMLKPLPVGQVNEELYDLEFIKENCAVLDANGKVSDLYIAMCEDTFSWPELQKSQPFLEGLETCWTYDTILDGPRGEEEIPNCKEAFEEILQKEEKLSAGDILRSWSPPATRLKRTASAVSRTSSFGSTDGDSKRARIQRQCVGGAVESLGRRAEAV
jgi:hypothetical protein